MRTTTDPEGTAFSAEISALYEGIQSVDLDQEAVVDCASAPNPRDALEQLLSAFGSARFGGVRSQAETLLSHLEGKRTAVQEKADRLLGKAAKGERLRVNYARMADDDIKPTLVERVQVIGLEIVASVALAGAIVTVAYALRTVNPDLWAEPDWKLFLMATPLLLSGKLGFISSLALLDLIAIRRLAVGFALVTAMAFLVWVTVFSLEVSGLVGSGSGASSFEYKANAGPDLLGLAPMLRFWSQLVAEVVGSCAVSAAAKLFSLRGRKVVPTISEESAKFSTLAAEEDDVLDQIIKDIAACEGIVSVVDAEMERIKLDARNRLEGLIRQADVAAANARADALEGARRSPRLRQLKLV